MDDKCHSTFVSAAGALTFLYKEIQVNSEKAYQQGRNEATAEIINWAESLNSQGLKYVQISSFLEMMQKYSSIKLNSFPESRKRSRDTP